MIVLFEPFKANARPTAVTYTVSIFLLALSFNCLTGIIIGDISSFVPYVFYVFTVFIASLPLVYIVFIILVWVCSHRIFFASWLKCLCPWRSGYQEL